MSSISLYSPWKKDFSLFEHTDNHDLSYLDSAATMLMPKSVVQAVSDYQLFHHANSHRGFYRLSAKSTEIVEQTRQQVASFINAQSGNDIIFTDSATSAINIVANSYLKHQLTSKHNVLISISEHHANFLPWQQLCQDIGAELRVIPLLASGEIDLVEINKQLDVNTALVAVTHVSNVLGIPNPVEQISEQVRKYDAKLVIDGAQAVAHSSVDVQQLGCDFYVFSGHKCYAGNGIGVLYAPQSVQLQMQPSILGGGIVDSVTLDRVSYCKGPQKFEAGSRNVAALVALNAAINYIKAIEHAQISAYIQTLAEYLIEQLSSLAFVHFVILPRQSGIVSFNVEQVHSHDVATFLDKENIAVRAGHHCAQPLHKYLNIKSSVRISLGIYNDTDDIDKLIKVLTNTYEVMRLD